MSHFANIRNLTTALLGTAIAFGAMAPAFAQPQDRDGNHGGRQNLQELRDQRRAKREEARASSSERSSPVAVESPRAEPRAQPQPESRTRPLRDPPVDDRGPRADNPQGRFGQAWQDSRTPRSSDAQRRENWGELARQQQDRQRAAEQQRQADQRAQEQQRREAQRQQASEPPRSPQAALMQQALARDAQHDDRRDNRDWRNDRRDDRRDDRDWRGNRDDRDDGDNRQHDWNNRIPRDQQQRRIEEQRRQQAQWQREEFRRRAEYQRHYNNLNREHRNAQYRYQQDYWRRWQAEQARWNRNRFDYNNPFFYTPYNYRYNYGGRWYSTNSYGAQMLQQAIRDGYREGWYAGQADRADRWRFDYQNNYGYLDGSMGYNGVYVSQSDYRYYFRQGFERGYRDGYYGRYQYGRYDNGSAMILPAILGMILAFSIN